MALAARNQHVESRPGLGWECLSFSKLNLHGFAFELMHVAGGCAIDGDLPWLHGLGNFPDQLDLEQAVVKRRAPFT